MKAAKDWSGHPRLSVPSSWHARGTAWHGPAIRVARRWHARATVNKINDLQVADSKISCHGHFGLKNKGFARVCSLLRYVWRKYEAGTAEWALVARSPQRSGRKKPANLMAQCASTPLRAATNGAFLTLVLAALSLPCPAASEGWATSGSFDAGEADEMRKAHAERAARKGWSMTTHSSARLSDWVALDAFERSLPGKARPKEHAFLLPSGSARDKLLALIAFAESPGAGYDAVHHAAKIQPPKAPSDLSLDEIVDWIAATPGQHHAIGRYQIIPSTLARLQDRLSMPGSTRFSATTQDRMADMLLMDAGFGAFRAGRITQAAFMDRLAKVWAGLPLASGLSAYHDHAGNRATISRAFFEAQMARIFANTAASTSRTDFVSQPLPRARTYNARSGGFE